MITEETEDYQVTNLIYDPYAIINQSLSNQEESVTEKEPTTDVAPAVEEEQSSSEPEVVSSVEDFFSRVSVTEEWKPVNVSQEELPNWYENKYKQLLESVAGDSFKQTVLGFFQEDLLKEVENVEEFKKHYVNFQNNPALYAAQYFPDSLAKIGIEPVLTKEQVFQAVEQEMAKEFGDNYQRLIDPSEAFKLGTYSYSILEKQRELLNQISAKNEENKAKYSEVVASKLQPSPSAEPLDAKTLEAFAKQEYAKFERKVGSEQDFVNFVQESYNQNWLPTTEQIWTIKNLDKILEDEYKRGISDGNKKQASEIRKQYGVEPQRQIERTSSVEKNQNSEKVHRHVFDPYAAINQTILGE